MIYQVMTVFHGYMRLYETTRGLTVYKFQKTKRTQTNTTNKKKNTTEQQTNE